VETSQSLTPNTGGCTEGVNENHRVSKGSGESGALSLLNSGSWGEGTPGDQDNSCSTGRWATRLFLKTEKLVRRLGQETRMHSRRSYKLLSEGGECVSVGTADQRGPSAAEGESSPIHRKVSSLGSPVARRVRGKDGILTRIGIFSQWSKGGVVHDEGSLVDWIKCEGGTSQEGAKGSKPLHPSNPPQWHLSLLGRPLDSTGVLPRVRAHKTAKGKEPVEKTDTHPKPPRIGWESSSPTGLVSEAGLRGKEIMALKAQKGNQSSK